MILQIVRILLGIRNDGRLKDENISLVEDAATDLC